MKPEIILGEKITVEKEYKRVRRWDYSKDHGQRMKEWEMKPIKPITGVIVGIRTLSNGRTDFDNEAGYMYSPNYFFKALLVSVSLYRKPILVPLTY